MKIGIIGAGNIGATLARKLTKAGHSVLIANSRGPETLKSLANETGAKAVSAREATQGVDVVILSIPFGKLPLLGEFLAGLPDEVVVADTLAGDESAAKKAVMSLVDDTGFDAIDGGPLAESWRQQPITRAYCSELRRDELRAALASADRARAPRQREQMVKEFMALGDKITPADIVRLHRAASAA